MEIKIDVKKFLEWLEKQRGDAAVNVKMCVRRERYDAACVWQAMKEVYDKLISQVKFPDPTEIDWIERVKK